MTAMIRGRGLFSGRESVVRLARRDGPICVSVDDVSVALDRLSARAGDRTTVLFGPHFRLGCVEHLFAAVGGLGIRRGLEITAFGDELPLLDGGAAAWAAALATLSLASEPPAARIVVRGEISVGVSSYVFEPADDVACEVRFEDPDFGATAVWDGRAEAFVAEIAPARTFVHEADLEAMAARGSSATVSPESVVVLARGGATLSAGGTFQRDEPARHKLLDLIGDLTLHGGPPAGKIVATRPGHAATHEAVARARAAGLWIDGARRCGSVDA